MRCGVVGLISQVAILKVSPATRLRNIACIYGYDHAMSFAVRSRLSLSSLADKYRLTHLSFELRLGCTCFYSAPKKLALGLQSS